MRWHTFSELLTGLGQLILPNSCLLCCRPEAEQSFLFGLCEECRLSVGTDPHESCPRCAATVGPHTDTSRGCSECRDRSFAFHDTIRLGPYESSLRSAVLRMKSSAGEGLAECLGMLFADLRRQELARHALDVVIPVPLHWRRRMWRGYNQSEAVAREVANALELPCESGWVRRIRATPQQVQPSAAARQANVRGAFQPGRSARFAGRRVLVIDDVMTTWSTLGEVARVIRQAGAAVVVAGILARA